MIVPTMTNLEVYGELEKDLPKVKIRANNLEPKVIKEFRKNRHFPLWKCFEYTHQESGNKYLISFHAASAKETEKPIIDYMGVISDNAERLIIKWGVSPYRLENSDSFIGTRTIDYYDGHFFGRYPERVFPDVELSPDELVCRYFTRNRRVVPIKLNEDITRRYKDYGESAQCGMRVADGLCFTFQGCEGDESSIKDRDSNFIYVVWYHSIVSNRLLKEGQTNAIEIEGKEFLRINIFEPFMKALKREIQKLPPQLRPPEY